MMYGRWDGSSAPWYGMVFGPIMMIVFIVLAVVIIAWLLRRTGRGPRHGCNHGRCSVPRCGEVDLA